LFGYRCLSYWILCISILSVEGRETLIREYHISDSASDMRTRRKFDREFKQMVIELSNNRKDFAAEIVMRLFVAD